MITLQKHTIIDIPKSLALCPICGEPLMIVDCDEWTHGDDGYLIPSHIDIECATEPDLDNEEWWDWHAWHYKMPYVDWLPTGIKVLEWFRQNYRYERNA